MKVLLICLLGLLLANTNSAQISTKLDAKNGFKSYQIGETKLSMENRGLKLRLISAKDRFYHVINNKESTLFHFDVEDVKVSFNKEFEVTTIWITLNSGIELGEVGLSFSSLLGERRSKGVSSEEVPYEAWMGIKTGLYVYYYPPFSGNGAGWQPLVFIYNIAEDRSNLDAGF